MIPAAKTISLAKLRRTTFPEPEPLVKGFLYASDTVVLAGRPKVGKSRLVNQLIISLSRGLPFLSMEVPRPVRVLSLDLENRQAGARHRFQLMSQPHPGDDLVHIFAPETLSENSIACATPEGISRMQHLVEELEPDLLIVDPWRLFLGGNGNDDRVVVDGLKVLSTLREARPKLAILIIHHVRKQDTTGHVSLRSDPATWVESASGSYALVAHAAATYGIEREIVNGEELIVFGGVARSVVPPTLILEEDEETLLFRLAKGAAVAEQLFSPVQRQIWEVASKLGTFTHGQLVTSAQTKNKKAVSGALAKAESSGLLEHLGKQYRVLQMAA